MLPLAPSIILIPLCWVFGQGTQTRDYEKWSAITTKVAYFEDWNERVPCSHPIYQDVPTGTDSNGNTTYTSVYVGDEHAYDVVYHPEEWIAYSNTGKTEWINKNLYLWAKQKFGNNTFVDLRRDYHTNDGDKYESIWDRSDQKFIGFYTKHSYKNKVLPNTGLFDFGHTEDIDPATVYEWPDRQSLFHDPAILGTHPDKNKADWLLQKFNSEYGPSRQIRTWILLFENVGREKMYHQRDMWQGGNKNEFVVCIGLDSDQAVMWCDSFYWSPDGYAGNHRLGIEVRDFVEEQDQLDLVQTVNFIAKTAPEHWRRKEFAELEYLQVPTPRWAIITNLILTILSCIAVGLFVITNYTDNEWENSSERSRYSSFRGKRNRMWPRSSFYS